MRDARDMLELMYDQHPPRNGATICISNDNKGVINFIVHSLKEYDEYLKKHNIEMLRLKVMNSTDKESPILICMK